MVDQVIKFLLENDAEDFGDEDLRDIWADTTDIEKIPVGTLVQINREHSKIHGLIGTVIKSRFDKAVVRLNLGEWELAQLVGEPEDFVLPLDEIIPISESEEDFEDEEFDASQAQDVRDVDAHTLDDIKAAEPGFFSRTNNKLFGTKKIYQYGHFLVLKNVRKHQGHFGNVSYYTTYVIYEFVKTDDAPGGRLKCRGDAKDLQDAKEQIKLKDFRSRLERTRDMISKMGKPAVAESEDDEFADVGDLEHLSAEIPRPMRFRDIPVGGIFSNSCGNRMTKLNNQEVQYDNGGKSELGNPAFMCYPPNWTPSMAKSYSKRVHTFPRLKENEDDDDFDAELAKEIGTPDPMPNWRDHNVHRETKEFALVTFQNGKTGLICLIPNHHPERVLVREPSSIRYLMGLSDKEFGESAVMEFGCGVWATSDEESEEIERELDGG